MDYQRRPSAISHISLSDTELDMIDKHADVIQSPYMSDLHAHSHFFAPARRRRRSSVPSLQRYSIPVIFVSPDNSTHSSTSNIAAVSSVTATGSTHHHHHQNNRANLSPPSTSAAPVVTRDPQKTKKFSLNLNGRLSPSSPDDIPEDSQEKMGPAQGSMHHGNRYVNKESLAKDLSLLSTMPELCDVTFLVGEDRQPVCGVRAILAARSR